MSTCPFGIIPSVVSNLLCVVENNHDSLRTGPHFANHGISRTNKSKADCTVL